MLGYTALKSLNHNFFEEKMNKNSKTKRQIGKWRSWETTEGVIRAPHRSMMRAMGLTDKDIEGESN